MVDGLICLWITGLNNELMEICNCISYMPIAMLNLHFHGNGSVMTPSTGWIHVERILHPTNSYTRIGILVSKQNAKSFRTFWWTPICNPPTSLIMSSTSKSQRNSPLYFLTEIKQSSREPLKNSKLLASRKR
ncbi:hypothetical protein ACJW31_03G036700 [Castanea mollissima]